VRQVSIAKPDITSVLMVCEKAHSLDGFVSFSLNEPPPIGLNIGLEQFQTIVEVVERFNRIHAPALWMHDEWHGLIGRIKKRQAARERGEPV
jgi:hypothetical protein